MFSLLRAQDSTGTLKGTVKDNNGDIVAFANVALYFEYKLVTGTVAGINGEYNVNFIKPGIYDVKVSYLGHIANTVSRVQIKPGAVTLLDLTLKKDGNSITITETVTAPDPKDKAAKKAVRREKSTHKKTTP